MSKLVSVIIPSFNHSKYILNCLNSIYNQTYKNIELVVFDDCSTDESFEILEDLFATTAFSKRFANLNLKRNVKNIGASETLNAAIKDSKGDYVAICNSDDYFSSERIEGILSGLNVEKQFGFSSVIPVDDSNNDRNIDPVAFSLTNYIPSSRFESVKLDLIYKNVAVSSGNFIFSRDVFDALGGFIDLKYCHDWDFILRASLLTDIYFDRDSFYYYRFHEMNSFQSLSDIASMETDVVYMNFTNLYTRSVFTTGDYLRSIFNRN